MTSLAGRNVLLTGASSGVGRHLARMLARHGARVVCCARREAELASLVAEIASAGGSAIAQVCDVSSEASVKAAFDRAEAEWGMVDSVIVNAGITNAMPAVKMSVESFDQLMAINLRGSFLTAREAGLRMIAAGPPDPSVPRRVVFIASTTARKPEKGAVAYGASKAGMVMIAKTLALEWARHDINVNAILPGFMPTEIVTSYLESDEGRQQIAGWPRKRVMPVEDIDAAVRFLLSAGSRSVSGIELVVDDLQAL